MPPLALQKLLAVPSLLHKRVSMRTIRGDKSPGLSPQQSVPQDELVLSRPPSPPPLPQFSFAPALISQPSDVNDLKKRGLFVREYHPLEPNKWLPLQVLTSLPTYVNGIRIPYAGRLKEGDLVKYGTDPVAYYYDGKKLYPQDVFIGNQVSSSLSCPRQIDEGEEIGRDIDPLMGLDQSVSRRHARLDFNGVLEDLGSTNGTYVNGQKITVPTPLKEDDLVKFGHPDSDTLKYKYDGKSLLPFDSTVHPAHIKLWPNSLITVAQNQPPLTVQVDGQEVSDRYSLKDGNIIRLGKTGHINYYYDNGKLIPLTKEKADLLLHLFPEGVRDLYIQQGQLGDCNVIGPLVAVSMHNPVKLIEIFERKDDDTIIVNLPGAPHPIEAKLANDYKTNGVQGCLGVRLLETVLGRAKKPLVHQNTQTTQATVDILDKADSADKALKLLTDESVIDLHSSDETKGLGEYPEHRATVLDYFDRIASDPKRYLAIVNTRSNPGNGLIGPHSYAVKAIDIPGERMWITDPHDSKYKTFEISFAVFFKEFKGIFLVSP